MKKSHAITKNKPPPKKLGKTVSPMGKVPAKSSRKNRDSNAGNITATKKVVPGATKIEEKTHAKRSPSTLKNREQCPGFEPRNEESAASAEGTLLHGVMEKWADAFSNGQPYDYARGLDNEQISIIEKLIEYMSQIIVPNTVIQLEIKLDLRSLDLPGCDWGTADFVKIDGNQATLVDYKFGRVEVDDPEENVQFHAYALALFKLYSSLEEIYIEAPQPRLDSIGQAVFTRADIPRLRLRLKTIVERCENVGIEINGIADGYFSVTQIHDEMTVNYPPLNPQTSLCEYCAMVGICPAVAKFALKVTPGPDLPDELDPTRLASDEMGLGRLFQWTKLLAAKAEALENAILELAKGGSEVAGYSLLNSSGKTSVLDPIGLAEEIEKTLNFTKEQIYSCSEISLSKVADIVSKNAPKGQKEKAAQEVRRNLTDGGFFKLGYGYSYLKKTK